MSAKSDGGGKQPGNSGRTCGSSPKAVCCKIRKVIC